MDCSHTLSRWQPQVRVAYDYYPFGLTWHNPAAADTPEGRHDHAYQDKEFQWNEFGAGAGMALYDFHARMYDPATATWSVPDPAEQFANPYLAMGNSPVMGVDPDGRFVVSMVIVGTLVGAYVGGAMAAGADNKSGFDANPFDGSWKGTKWWIGALIGGAVGAGLGYTAIGMKTSGGISILGKTISKEVSRNLFSSIVSGTVNTISNYDPEKGFGWHTLGNFAAGAIGGYTGSAFGMGWGVHIGGLMNVINKDIQLKTGFDSNYEAGQAYVGGGLSSLAGMQMAGMTGPVAIPGDHKIAKLTNKFLGYGIQSTASDFAYSKKKDFVSRSFGQHAAMFIVGGTAGTVLSEVYKGGLSKSNFPRTDRLFNSWRILAVATVGAIEFYHGSFVKGNGVSPYMKQPQINKGNSIAFKNLLYSLLNIN
jgi:RHS repeat-associated protein